jgi:hypothetical protein
MVGMLGGRAQKKSCLTTSLLVLPVTLNGSPRLPAAWSPALGMSEKLGPIGIRTKGRAGFPGTRNLGQRDYSEAVGSGN